ncbi:L-serine ammonia-lyase, iron-sulfur-dependent, subunit alpha [uncultured Megasphaera sp.]|uniref:L-serine ammonia-lyase, iron-sulfur-dependent, subunit alpha n=1 Tax=uncultured Megasphaera sp. TaxID=165188 RepID=UPI002596C659|nr:L-serine ammonia-lyase, iron-sulfur-dependent, subunit alpha [uncultured Megasphaera sp.]
MFQYEYKSIQDLVKLTQQYQTTLADIIIRHEMEQAEKSEGEIRQLMEERIVVFHESVQAGLNDTDRSVSGLVGGDAARLQQHPAIFLGSLANKALSYAVAIAEANAKMFKIVACPTAGSCGIVPAVLLAVAEERHIGKKEQGEAMFIAAGVGAVVSHKATVAGAVGGCQAECGSAAAMAAAVAAYLCGGTTTQILHAFALCMKNTLGLACDPVAGLVEVPCVKRNGCYAVLALTAAEMALAGIESVIPPDEVIEAMGEIGRLMPVALKETSEGGLAQTETGKAIAARLEKAMNA